MSEVDVPRHLHEQSLKDIDRVTAERDAALGQLKDKREEFSKLGDRYDALQQRLTAADELVCERTDSILKCGASRKALDRRVDVLDGLLREASVELHDFITGRLLDRIDAAIKPAVGGGDE